MSEEAKKQKFTMRNIVDPEVRGHTITQFPFAKTKYTLQKEFSEMSVTWIFGGKVVISNWTEEEPVATIIENPQIVKMYQKQFESLWNQTTYTLTGEQGVQVLFDELLTQKEIRFIGGNWGMKKYFPKAAQEFLQA